jgi:CheY-like chemotaxis protein
MGKITVLLIEEDDDVRPVLRHNLQTDGYDVLVAVDEQSALAWITSARARFDLILINLVGKTTDEALDAGRRVKKQAGLDGSTSLIVIAEKYTGAQEGQDVEVGRGEWVSYPENSEQLHSLLRRLAPADG